MWPQWPCISLSGLSPRVRGNPIWCDVATALTRSIPACAGEPGESGRDKAQWRVYPRVCGGTEAAVGIDVAGLGLSPRVRGNRVSGGFFVDFERSIPACAGEPFR